MKRTMEYEAFDGTRFTTAEACKQHDTKTKLMRLAQMSEAQVMAAIDRTDVELADAIEFAGNMIAEKRRSGGGFRRKRKQAG